MSNQTLKPPSTNRRSRAKAKPSYNQQRYQRQTASFEGIRDGEPLIFGWGRHLTRVQKTRIQRLVAYIFAAVVALAIVGVFIFGWVQQNILIPNQTIASVNGTNVTQDTYRKTLAINAQNLWNTLQAELKQHAEYQQQLAKADNKDISSKDALLTQTIQTEEAGYAQAQITQTTIQMLQEDLLIQEGAKRFEAQNHVPASTFQPSASTINAKLASFKKAFPAGQSYADFLKKNNMTEADVRAAIAISLRRDMMQKYLASQIKSPAQQVHLRRIETNTQAAAQKVYDQISKDPNNANLWNTLAKAQSLDVNSKDKGGDMGWISEWTGDAAIDNWAFASGRKMGDLSTVLKDANGTFDVVQVLGSEQRPLDTTTINDAKSNALYHWLTGQEYSNANHVSKPDSTMLTATRNMPVTPDLNAQLPNVGSSNGAAGSLPAVPGTTGP